MGDEPYLRRKAEVLSILKRAGYSEETVDALDAELPDPVGVDRDGNIFLRHGITLGNVMDRMGGSP